MGGVGETFQLLDVLYFYLNLVSTSRFPCDSGANSSAGSQGRDLITRWGKCRRHQPGRSLHLELEWSPRLLCGVALGCLPGGARLAGWRGHLLCSVLPGTGPCWGGVGFISLRLFISSARAVGQICGWETGSRGRKSPPGPNAFCLLQQLPNSCHVWAGMGDGAPLLGKSIEAVSRKACSVLQRTDFCLPSLEK